MEKIESSLFSAIVLRCHLIFINHFGIKLNSPIVFISYSHDTQEHKKWVLDLATRLRSSGIDAILDQWDLGPGGDLPQFMEQNISRAGRVLMICTERYVQKANMGLGGVGYEKMIVTADSLKTIGANSVIPVVRQNGTIHLPTFLGTKLYIDLSNDDFFESGMDQLLRELLNAPLFIKPPIGTDPFLSPKGTAQPASPTPVAQFMNALATIYDDSSDNGMIRTEWVRTAMNTSKLFFDHALDQAMELGYVVCEGSKEIIWIKAEGRAKLVMVIGSSQR